MSHSQDETYYEDMIPEGSVPMYGFRLLSFMGDDGKLRYRMSSYGEGVASHVIGMLEMAKHKMLRLNDENKL